MIWSDTQKLIWIWNGFFSAVNTVNYFRFAHKTKKFLTCSVTSNLQCCFRTKVCVVSPTLCFQLLYVTAHIVIHVMTYSTFIHVSHKSLIYLIIGFDRNGVSERSNRLCEWTRRIGTHFHKNTTPDMLRFLQLKLLAIHTHHF
jgi:hypothetical protein